MVTPIAKTFVSIGADLSGLDKGLAGSAKKLSAVGKTVGKVGKSLSLKLTAPIAAC